MRTILLSGAGALALLAAPAMISAQPAPAGPTPAEDAAAQNDASPSAAVPGSTNTVDDKKAPFKLTAEQQALYDAWPAERRSDYDAWPGDYQTYYWTLEPDQQTGYWALSPDQRKAVYDMTPEQRTQAWASIVQQVQANPPSAEPASPTPPNPPTANSAVPPSMPADPNYNGGAYKGAASPPPAEAAGKEYPVCSKTVQDSCRNRGGK